jgi:RNA polymerase sigma-70 factor (ECF subfamily)
MNVKKTIALQKLMAVAHQDFNKVLNSHAFFKVHNHEMGEDLVQDTFVKTWSYLVKGGKIDIMKAFLYHVLNNLIIDQYRKRKTTSLDILLEKGLVEPKDDYSEHLIDILDGKAALISIAKISKKYQKVMRMKYVQDLSLEEMSLVVGQSKKTIAVQIYRGLKELKLLCNRSK